MLVSCNSCARRLPLDAFPTTADGPRGKCRDCRNAYERDLRRRRRDASPAWAGYVEMCGPVPDGRYPHEIDGIWCALDYRGHRRLLAGWTYDPCSGVWARPCARCGVITPEACMSGCYCRPCRASYNANRRGGAR